MVSSHPPFTEGGHLVIGRSLVAALRDAGHEAERVLTPQNRFGRQAAAYAATWLTDLEESDGRKVDQVVSLRLPAYAVRHPRQVCWLNHTMREYYDQWPAFAAGLSVPGRLKERERRVIVHAADRRLLGPSRLARLFAQSRTIASRLREHLGLAADVLYPPPPPRRYRTDRFGDYVFAVSRLTPLKRIDLLVRALAEPAGQGLRAVVAGDGEILLHAPLTSETRHMIDVEAFRRMTKRPILVNTARGAIIDMEALIRAWEEGQISGLGLDVMWDEPPDWEAPAVQRLLGAENVVFSPHCGSHTREAFQRLTKVCLDNVEAFLNGVPTNVVV